MASDNKVRIQVVPITSITFNEAASLIYAKTDYELDKWQKELEKEVGTFAANQRIEKCRPIVYDCVKHIAAMLLKEINRSAAYAHLRALRQIEIEEDALFSKN